MGCADLLIEGTVIRLDVDHLPSGAVPKPVWLWWSGSLADTRVEGFSVPAGGQGHAESSAMRGMKRRVEAACDIDPPWPNGPGPPCDHLRAGAGLPAQCDRPVASTPRWNISRGRHATRERAKAHVAGWLVGWFPAGHYPGLVAASRAARETSCYPAPCEANRKALLQAGEHVS
jgi:hypothetical protein